MILKDQKALILDGVIYGRAYLDGQLVFDYKVKDLTVTDETDDSFKVNFTPLIGATSYNVYSGATLLGTVTASGQTVTGLTSATIYNVVVKAVKGGVEGNSSNVITVETWAAFPVLAETELHLMFQTTASKRILIDWGDGNTEIVNSNSNNTHNYSTATTTKVLIKVEFGTLGDITLIRSNEGHLNFNISKFSQIPNCNYFRFAGDHTLTGDLKACRMGSRMVLFTGDYMSLTYSTAIWTNISNLNLRLATGSLDDTSTSNLLVDTNAGAVTGAGTYDIRGPGQGIPNVAGAAAVTALQGKGRTVLTN